MFATKENSYIYIAIFGSFLVLRLGLTLWQSPWFHKALGNLTTPLMLVAFGSLFWVVVLSPNARPASRKPKPRPRTRVKGLPQIPMPAAATTPVTTPETGGTWGWVQFGGIVLASIGLFLGVKELWPCAPRIRRI